MTLTVRIVFALIALAILTIYAFYLWPRVEPKVFDLRMSVRGWWTRAIAEYRARRSYGRHYGKVAR